MTEAPYDLIVIGSGPGGEGAAMRAAKAGRSVLVVERGEEVGGACTHSGTIPSKALRYAVRQLVELGRSPFWRDPAGASLPTFPDLLRGAAAVIARQVDLRRGFYERNQVRVAQGHARFRDPSTIEVRDDRGAVERFSARAFVIATGARPYRPADVDFDHPRIFDSDTILQLTETPRSMTIYGAGIIGCEYASIFRSLGVKLNLVNTRAKLLEFLDDEIADALAYHLREHGALLRHSEEVERVEPLPTGVVLHLRSGKKLRTDALLWANGRTGNTQDLGLEMAGISPDHRGQIGVDESFRTSVAHIFAVGDVIGPPALASAAYDQGRAAVAIWLDGRAEHRLDLIPTGIYTTPEISSVGRTERELTAAAVPYEVGHAFFRSIARAQISGQTAGMLKILFHRETLAILGIHCFGDQASEIVHIGQAIMAQPSPQNSIQYFANTTFNYPTMAEAYRVAALNGLNRIY